MNAHSPVLTIALLAMIAFLIVQTRRDNRMRLENERLVLALQEMRGEARDVPPPGPEKRSEPPPAPGRVAM